MIYKNVIQGKNLSCEKNIHEKSLNLWNLYLVKKHAKYNICVEKVNCGFGLSFFQACYDRTVNKKMKNYMFLGSDITISETRLTKIKEMGKYINSF